jgi:hypothetical protein
MLYCNQFLLKINNFKHQIFYMNNISRRKALKQFVFVTAGLAIIPSCMQDRSKSALLLKKITIGSDDEAMLAELSETIIPKTTSPGAKDISAHLFVLKMVDDCTKKEDQEIFIKGMSEFKVFCKSNAGKDFVNCNAEERKKVLTDLIAKKDEENNLNAFFKTVKRFTIQAYTSSEFFLTKVQVYELVPGRYHGCVPA